MSLIVHPGLSDELNLLADITTYTTVCDDVISSPHTLKIVLIHRG